MVTSEVSSRWVQILEKYNKFIDKDYSVVDDTMETIQAQRILKAELSSREYGK